MRERQYRYMSASLFFLVVEHGACVESVCAFMLMAAIHEPLELSKGDNGNKCLHTARNIFEVWLVM